MPHLRIKNIGPIKYADIELNKVNVIMGPQSSGKSTINKIACYSQQEAARHTFQFDLKYPFCQ